MTLSLVRLPDPRACAPWCEVQNRKHRAGWDYTNRLLEADRTCRRRIGKVGDLEVLLERFDSYDYSTGLEPGTPGIKLDRTAEEPFTVAQSRRLASLLAQAAQMAEQGA
jgi:hypothetical protein